MPVTICIVCYLPNPVCTSGLDYLILPDLWGSQRCGRTALPHCAAQM